MTDTGPPGETTLDRAVRGAAGVARAYTRAGDRTGVITLYGPLRWIAPGTGQRQFFQIVESVLEIRGLFSFVSLDLTRIPSAVLPRGLLPFDGCDVARAVGLPASATLSPASQRPTIPTRTERDAKGRRSGAPLFRADYERLPRLPTAARRGADCQFCARTGTSLGLAFAGALLTWLTVSRM